MLLPTVLVPSESSTIWAGTGSASVPSGRWSSAAPSASICASEVSTPSPIAVPSASSSRSSAAIASSLVGAGLGEHGGRAGELDDPDVEAVGQARDELLAPPRGPRSAGRASTSVACIDSDTSTVTITVARSRGTCRSTCGPRGGEGEDDERQQQQRRGHVPAPRGPLGHEPLEHRQGREADGVRRAAALREEVEHQPAAATGTSSQSQPGEARASSGRHAVDHPSHRARR